MLVWNRGGTLVVEYNSRVANTDRLLTKVLEHIACRVPGAAVFMAQGTAGVHALLAHYVARAKSVHETVLLLHVETESVRVIEPTRRFQVRSIGNGLFEIVARYGFMERADIPALVKEVIAQGSLPTSIDEVTYFLGRESFVASDRGRMGRSSEALFAFMSRNSTPADRYFGIPPEQVIEIGTQLDS